MTPPVALVAATAVLSLAGTSPANATSSGGAGYQRPAADTGGATSEKPAPPVRPRLLPSGKVTVPAGLPDPVRAALRAGNRIVGKPYKWGGGHGSFRDSGYDCSGAVSYALHAADAVDEPMASGPLSSWGRAGEGEWITVYANAGHAWMTVAGVRLDTSAADDPGGGEGPRWRPRMTGTDGYEIRHPDGL